MITCIRKPRDSNSWAFFASRPRFGAPPRAWRFSVCLGPDLAYCTIRAGHAGALGLLFAFNVERLGGIITANYKTRALFEPAIFIIVAAALFWRRSNAWGVGLVALAWALFNGLVPERVLPPAELSAIERSWLNRFLGTGWTWLAFFVVAGVLVVVLYFF